MVACPPGRVRAPSASSARPAADGVHPDKSAAARPVVPRPSTTSSAVSPIRPGTFGLADLSRRAPARARLLIPACPGRASLPRRARRGCVLVVSRDSPRSDLLMTGGPQLQVEVEIKPLPLEPDRARYGRSQKFILRHRFNQVAGTLEEDDQVAEVRPIADPDPHSRRCNPDGGSSSSPHYWCAAPACQFGRRPAP